MLCTPRLYVINQKHKIPFYFNIFYNVSGVQETFLIISIFKKNLNFFY